MAQKASHDLASYYLCAFALSPSPLHVTLLSTLASLLYLEDSKHTAPQDLHVLNSAQNTAPLDIPMDYSIT